MTANAGAHNAHVYKTARRAGLKSGSGDALIDCQFDPNTNAIIFTRADGSCTCCSLDGAYANVYKPELVLREPPQNVGVWWLPDSWAEPVPCNWFRMSGTKLGIEPHYDRCYFTVPVDNWYGEIYFTFGLSSEESIGKLTVTRELHYRADANFPFEKIHEVTSDVLDTLGTEIEYRVAMNNAEAGDYQIVIRLHADMPPPIMYYFDGTLVNTELHVTAEARRAPEYTSP